MSLLKLAHHFFQLHCSCNNFLFYRGDISKLRRVLHLYLHQLHIQLSVVPFQGIELPAELFSALFAPVLLGLHLIL
jgi:hypothetical protein